MRNRGTGRKDRSELKDIAQLNEAFESFTLASRSLEGYYERLQSRVEYLSRELEERNRQLSRALQDTDEAKNYLDAIVQGLSEAIVVLDSAGRVTMINRAARDMLGLQASAAIGMEFGSLGIELEQDGVETVLVAGGLRRSVIVSRSSISDASGSARGSVVLFNDITRLRELEVLEERNHRLIAMGEMAANIVHEIRSPLCSIELYASMLARDLAGTEHTELAEGISTGIRSLNNVLSNMLYFAKPQRAGRKRIDLSGVLRTALDTLAPMLDAQGITVLTSGVLDDDEGRPLMGDAELLGQVFLNVVLNAAQAVGEGGEVEVRLLSTDEFAVAEVSDNGPGIRDEDLERIFDPFFSTRDRGTGLGLAIAAKIMQAHGGRIKVRSQVGRGSTFGLYLPLAALAGEGRASQSGAGRCAA